jgi:competence protein ComEC
MMVEASSKPVPMGVGAFPLFRRFLPTVSLPDAAAWRNTLPRALRACRDQALAERGRWPLWLPVAFGAGIGLYFALPFEPSAALALAVVVVGTAAAFGATFITMTAPRIVLCLFAAMAFGGTWAKLRTELVAAPVLTHRVGPAGFEGRIESVQAHGKGVRVVLGELGSRRFRPGDGPDRARISIRAATDILVPGNWVHVTAILMPPPAPAAPGGYDFGRAAYYDGIGAVGYAYGHAKQIAPLRATTWSEWVATKIQLLRWRMTARIHAVLPGSTGGIAAALITGDRGAISDDDEAALRDAGLAHVLAIAGLHMALMGLGLFWVVRAILAAIPPIALTQPIKKWAALAALCGAAFYLIISGGATPATRAFIMLAVMLSAVLIDRPALSMRSIALAAMVVLLLRPESLIEPGFQMSFAAVVSLIAVAEWEQARAARSEEGKPAFATLRRYLRGIATTSFVGSVATAPYAVFHFDRATHYAVLGNLLAMPIMGFVTMPAAAIAVAMMPFGLEAWPLRVMGWGIEAMLAVGRWVSSLPGAISAVPAWPVAAIVLLSLGGLWIALWRRSWRWIGLAPIAAGLVVAYSTHQPDLLVARDAETVAIRGSDGVLRLMRQAGDDYSADQWLRRDGDDRVANAAVAGPTDGVRCDGYGCIAKARDGSLIAAPLRLDALTEDCAMAAIVISAVPAGHKCVGPRLVVDKFDVARAGGYAVWFGPELRIETVEGERGLRPWSQPARRKRFNSGG